MDAGLLETLLGGNRTWAAQCVVILDAEATVQSPGPDSILGGGVKNYAPRYSSGRIQADAVCLLKEERALLVVQHQTYKDGTGQTHSRKTLVVAALEHVVAVEFAHLDPLKPLGVPAPTITADNEYRPGTLVG